MEIDYETCLPPPAIYAKDLPHVSRKSLKDRALSPDYKKKIKDLRLKILAELEKNCQPMSTDKFRVFADIMIEIASGETRNIDDLARRIRTLDMSREIISSAKTQRDELLDEFSKL